MKYFTTNEIREKFLAFFESKDHLRLDSFSLVPHDDPSILLINAGMTPMKKWFTGAELPPKRRIATCQKCVRTQDIEQVGQTARHGTYFEMLGNFSFGDYFKDEAIAWGWELLCDIFGMPENLLYVTVFEEDDEAYDIWTKKIGIPKDRILRLGKEDNFWEHGIGPCGPCSEIFFDRGEKYSCGPDCKFGCDCDRYIEIWNLVFTQFEKLEDGSYIPLENKNIDTGAGLERFAVVLQEVDNFFEVDNIQAVLQKAAKLAGVSYGSSEKTDVALRVITDHVRSSTMMISDGVIPSNEGRGYVLRRLLRRAIRYGRSLNMPTPFMHILAEVVIGQSADAYPALLERKEIIMTHINREEETFNKTLEQGLAILEDEIQKTKAEGKKELAGEIVFRLHDTFGFPYDLTREICEEEKLAVDIAGFRFHMDKQKEAGREAQLKKSASAWSGLNLPETVDRNKPTLFTGYDHMESEGKLLHIFELSNQDLQEKEELSSGESGILLFDQSPFYAEGGGQVGDRGRIIGKNTQVQVLNTEKDGDGLFFHHVTILEGKVTKDQNYSLQVDRDKRLATARNHTTTHLLHKALQEVLGSHVEQAGSHVDENYLRFDFRHFSALTEEELAAVEQLVNRQILEDHPIHADVMSIKEAQEKGAIALFSEKYGDDVRVISVGDYSKELCGGTHLDHSSQACYFRIKSEGGIASGVRRIEAVTGTEAFVLAQKEREELAHAAKALRSTDSKIAGRVEALLDENKKLEKELEALHAKQAASKAGDLVKTAEEVNGIRLVFAELDVSDAAALREAGDNLKNNLADVFLLLASTQADKVIWLAMASQSAVKAGLHSGNLIRKAAQITGGGGGGRPDMAQAGGKEPGKIKEALQVVKEDVLAILN